MSRTVKRVPIEFDWPQGRVWKGYRFPYRLRAKQCPNCRNEFGHSSGLNRESSRIARYFYAHHIDIWPLARAMRWYDKITQDEVLALVEAGRLMDFTHDWIRGEGWQRKNPPNIPTADDVNSSPHSHDTINMWILVETRCKRLGVWGMCTRCGGDGDLATQEQRQAGEEWQPIEPPSGDGWQLWETVSEGSPASPVFATAEGLADWCADNATLCADFGTGRALWLGLITGTWNMELGSMMASDGHHMDALINLRPV